MILLGASAQCYSFYIIVCRRHFSLNYYYRVSVAPCEIKLAFEPDEPTTMYTSKCSKTSNATAAAPSCFPTRSSRRPPPRWRPGGGGRQFTTASRHTLLLLRWCCLMYVCRAAAVAAIKVFEESQPFGKAFPPDRVGLVCRHTRPSIHTLLEGTFSWSLR